MEELNKTISPDNTSGGIPKKKPTKNIRSVDLRPGDTLHCTSDSFLARAIQWFTKSRINHTALVLRIGSEKFIVDSQRDGTNPRPIKEWLDKYQYKYIVHRPARLDIDAVKVRALSKVGNTPYDFAALLWHQPIYQLTGKWIGRKHTADKRMYCSEYIAWVYDFPNYWKLSPEALYQAMDLHPNFNRIY